MNYDDFFAKRAGALLKCIHLYARFKKQEFQEPSIPVVLIENNRRAKTGTIGYFVVVKGIQLSIKADIKKEVKPLWELRDMGLDNRKVYLLQTSTVLVFVFVTTMYFRSSFLMYHKEA
ncbi:hypothetical protein OPV22_009039 [Ensete ventricosum]|uniref:Uncharacterized protein n=1 Tax=Ensete ventricosum TaxID=4639 RepID=A0AAV8RCF9_ENSVE|nr:hypothetical protein OPV22_009039 [Ensete ventricosum]